MFAHRRQSLKTASKIRAQKNQINARLRLKTLPGVLLSLWVLDFHEPAAHGEAHEVGQRGKAELTHDA